MEPIHLLLGQLLINSLVFLIIYRKQDLPIHIKLLVIVSYITVHLHALKGTVESSIYLIDFVFPFAIFILLFRFRELVRNKFFLGAFAFLIFFPFLSMAVLVFCDNYSISMNDLVYFYRSLNYLAVFSVGLIAALSHTQTMIFIQMNILLAGILGIFGIISYLTPLKMDTFFLLKSSYELPSDYFSLLGIGQGFLGLFKGEAGQWFATIVMFSIVIYRYFQRNLRRLVLFVIILGICIISLSFSRTSMAGILFGTLCFYFSRDSRKFFRVSVILVFTAGIIYVSVGRDLLSILLEKYIIIDIVEGTFSSRLIGWSNTIDYFMKEPAYFLIGIGPFTDKALAKIIGLYGSHNEIFEVLFKSGLLGLISLFYFYYMVFTSNNPLGNNVGNGAFIREVLLYIFVVNIVIGLSQAHLIYGYAMYRVQFYLWFIYGVLMGGIITADYSKFVKNSWY